VRRAEDVVREAARVFRESEHIDLARTAKARADAEELLEFVLGHRAEPDEPVPPSALRRFRRLVARRATGEPVPYMTGRMEFMDLTLEVRPGVFVPRVTTELMVREAVRRLRARRAPVHVDLATGIGPVALAVARAVPGARVFGVDIAPRAVGLARRNARRLGLSNVTFLRGDLFAPLPRSLQGAVDVLTIHPPYVGRREVRELADEIKRFEPLESLTDRSETGLRLLERVVAEAPGWLAPGGWLLVEVSADRARQVSGLLRRGGFGQVRSRRGEYPWTRVVVGRRR
jgi:release factor glutamine methyltransferase